METQTETPEARGRSKRKIAYFAIGLLLVGGAIAIYATSGLYHFQAVEEGVLYRSGFLSGDEYEVAIDRYGIKTVVNLIQDVESRSIFDEKYGAQLEISEERGVELVHIPLNSNTPPTPEQLDVWHELVDDPARHPILVHCQHGVIRTGMLAAVYEIERHGKSGEEALEDFPTYGHRMNVEHRRPVREFVRNYTAREAREPGEEATEDAEAEAGR